MPRPADDQLLKRATRVHHDADGMLGHEFYALACGSETVARDMLLIIAASHIVSAIEILDRAGFSKEMVAQYLYGRADAFAAPAGGAPT